MNCPMFVDFSRECLPHIKEYPEKLNSNIIGYCTSDNHLECPFYKILKTKEVVCENILTCAAFKNFQSEEFNEFVAISNKYCTSENHIACQRYILKKKGETVPIALHPDGTTVAGWLKGATC
jgi:hypothetical protein